MMRLRYGFSITSLMFVLFAGLARTGAQTTVPRPPVDLTIDRDPAPSPDPETPPGLPNANSGPIAKGSDGRYTLKSDASEVRLTASVVDRAGRAVRVLDQDAFKVYEDGVPQEITSFRHDDVPVSIGLVIDSSASMYDKLEAVNKAAIELVRLSNPKDEEFLVDFSSQAYLDQGFTSSISKLQAGLSYLKPKGGTAAYDAILASADYLARDAKNTKKVLVLVTDGEDTASTTTLEQTIRRIQDLDGPTVYCVGLLFGLDTDKREAKNSTEVLQQIATQTGGVALFPKSLKTIDEVTSTVAMDVRSQYTITYRSTNPPTNGGYRQILVEAQAKGFKKLDVRTRKGYFPKTDQASSGQAPK